MRAEVQACPFVKSLYRPNIWFPNSRDKYAISFAVIYPSNSCCGEGVFAIVGRSPRSGRRAQLFALGSINRTQIGIIFIQRYIDCYIYM